MEFGKERWKKKGSKGEMKKGARKVIRNVLPGKNAAVCMEKGRKVLNNG